MRLRFLGGPYVLVGGLCGLTWAAGLRGWMAQLVGEASTYGWSTFILILLPGLVVGMLLGHATNARSRGLSHRRWCSLRCSSRRRCGNRGSRAHS